MKSPSKKITQLDWENMQAALHTEIERLQHAKDQYETFLKSVHDYCRVISRFDTASQVKVGLFLLASDISYGLGVVSKAISSLCLVAYAHEKLTLSSHNMFKPTMLAMATTLGIGRFRSLLEKWYEHWNNVRAEDNLIENKVISTSAKRFVYRTVAQEGNIFVDKFLKHSRAPFKLLDRALDLQKQCQAAHGTDKMLYQQTASFIGKIHQKQAKAHQNAQQRTQRLSEEERDSWVSAGPYTM